MDAYGFKVVCKIPRGNPRDTLIYIYFHTYVRSGLHAGPEPTYPPPLGRTPSPRHIASKIHPHYPPPPPHTHTHIYTTNGNISLLGSNSTFSSAPSSSRTQDPKQHKSLSARLIWGFSDYSTTSFYNAVTDFTINRYRRPCD